MSLLIFPLVWIIMAAGRTLADWLRLPDTAAEGERNLIAFGLGLGLLAYGVLTLGLLHLLYPVAGLAWTLALALLGAPQHRVMAQQVRGWRPRLPVGWEWAAAASFAAFGGLALVAVYAPPVVFIPGINATEWDSLSYHLADPKLFLQMHRIVSFPWQPHSNFAFTAEMWYTLALMAHGSVPLAKWFSWLSAAGTALGVYSIASRHLSVRAGAVAALLYVATPLVFWEAGTAYIDGATAFFATLSLLCVFNGLLERQGGWLTPGAILMGLAFSTKASALELIVLLAVGVLIWNWRLWKISFATALRNGVGWGALAVLTGCPWYIKSWIATGNPVYPYFYQIFGGRWWNNHLAAAYASTNNAGFGHTLSALVFLPWNLTMALPPGHVLGRTPPFNEFPSALLSLSPVLLGVLFFPAYFSRPVPPIIKGLGIYALAATVLWFTQTQYIRFLLPLVPVYCLLAGWAVCRAWEWKAASSYALALLTAFFLMWSLSVGFQLAAVQWPAAVGTETKAAYVARFDDDAGAYNYINTQLPRHSKIALFGHPLGFYCDRPYLWGDQSAYVMTPRVHSPQSLLSRLHALRVTTILVDTRSYPFAPGNSPPGWLYALTAARSAPLYPPVGAENTGVYVYALPAP